MFRTCKEVLVILLLVTSCFTRGLKVLLLGDSIDRFAVTEWCRVSGLDTREWGGKDLAYSSGKTGRQGSLCCITKNGEIGLAFVHIFGSNSTGPYINNLGGGFEDTELRITHSLNKYTSLFGIPHKIYLRFSVWDIGRVLQSGTINTKSISIPSSYQNVLRRFRANLNDRINQINNYFNHSYPDIVGLRTAGWSYVGGSILRQYNEITRHVASERNLTLFDLDLDLWSIVGFNTSVENERYLFRDSRCHPVSSYSYIQGQKVLELQYSRYLIHPSVNASVNYHHKFLDALKEGSIKTVHNYSNGTQNLTIRLIKTSQSLYYLNEENLSLHIIHNHDFLRGLNIFYLGIGDAFFMNLNQIQSNFTPYKIGESVPTELMVEHTVFNTTHNTSQEMLYILQFNKLRKLPSKRALFDVIKFNGKIVQVDNPETNYYFRQIQLGSEVNQAFTDVKDEFLMRISNQKQLFYVTNGTYHPLNSMNFFSRHPNLDLQKDMVILHDDNDIHLFKLGHKMN